MEKKLLLLLTFIGIKTLHSSVLTPPYNGDKSTCGLSDADYHRMTTPNFINRCFSILKGIENYLEESFNRCLKFNGTRQNCYNNYLLNINDLNEDERFGKPNGEAAKRKAAALHPLGQLWWATKNK